MKNQINLLTKAISKNKDILYKGKVIFAAYMPTLDHESGKIKILLSNLETDFVNIFKLEVSNEN